MPHILLHNDNGNYDNIPTLKRAMLKTLQIWYIISE